MMYPHLAPAPAYVPTYVTLLTAIRDENAFGDFDRLEKAWLAYAPYCREIHGYSQWVSVNPAEFVDMARLIFADDDTVDTCASCCEPRWRDDLESDDLGTLVCEGCRDEFPSCGECGNWRASEDYISYACDQPFCPSCWSSYVSYCDDCDEYYVDDCCSDEHDHDRESYCQCEPHDLHFTIAANSHGEIHQDERLNVTLPSGVLTDEAITAIQKLLWAEQLEALYTSDDTVAARARGDWSTAPNYYGIYDLLDSLGREWQTKQGNYTKRLGRLLYQNFKIKLDTGLLSKVGSTARSFTDQTSDWHVEVTRDFNQPASAFYHEDSCWWLSYNESLCSLKHWGGFALRTYADENAWQDNPTGRAWVQPLDADLQPTLDARNAHAYVVYNGYGNLAGYTGARLMAYLTSKSYKKIDFSAQHQYVNSGGYLIADPDVLEATTGITIGDNLSPHTRIAA